MLQGCSFSSMVPISFSTSLSRFLLLLQILTCPAVSQELPAVASSATDCRVVWFLPATVQQQMRRNSQRHCAGLVSAVPFAWLPYSKKHNFFFLVKKLFSQIVKNVFDRLCQVLCLCCVLPLAKSTTLLNILVFLLFQPLNVYVCMYLSSSVFGSFPQEIVWWKEATFSVVPLHSMKIKPAAEVKHKSTFFLFASSNLKR